VYSVYYNPASVDYVNQQQIAAEYTGMFLGLPESVTRAFIGYVFPTKKVGSFGFYWNTLQASLLYSENVFAIVYSKQKIVSYLPRLSAGVRPKIYYTSFAKPDGIYDNSGWWTYGTDTALKHKSSKLAVGVDLGFSYSLAQNYILGLFFENINQPNISLFDNSDVVIPTKFLAGITNINPIYGLNLEIGIKGHDFISSFGVQYRLWKDKLRLYGSVKLTSRGYNTKTVALIEPSFGGEFVFDGVNIAYAFNYPLSGVEVFGNHTVSVAYRFGPVVKLAEDTSVLYAKIDNLEKQLKQKDAEIEQLKKQIDELLKKPLPTEVRPEKPKITPPVKPQEPVKEKVEEKELTPKQQYETLFNKYLQMKDQLSFTDRLKTIDTLIRQFKGKTDISQAEKEFNELVKQQKAVIEEMQTAKSYYYRLKSSGTAKKELVELLERIKKKYSGYGLDLNWVEEELRQLR
ncbi:MAG: conjugal transfer protein TraF, partial [Endomicrobia bacterium]|nr:conjugal transfer protein TraF [Endomicrobiia bacterium]